MIVRRRSILYLSGSSQRMMAKAGSRGADVLVLDLEDGVHPNLKSTAREQIQGALERFDWSESEVFIRANVLDTAWGCGRYRFHRRRSPTRRSSTQV